MTTEQDWYKGKYKSLVGLLQENRRVNKEYQKRNKGFIIAIISEFVIFAALILVFVVFGMRNSNRDTRNFVLILLLAIILIFTLLDAFLWYMNIYKPKKEFIKKTKEAYPGIDLSTESSIKKYLWTFKDRELLSNLEPLIVWEVAIRNPGGAVGPNSYTEAERVVRDVWTTNRIDHELYNYYHYGEHVISYLEGVVGSFGKIGAVGEAQIWAEAYHLFEKLEILENDTIAPEPNDTNVHDDVDYYVYEINGSEGVARFACTEDERVWLTDLKKRHEELREKTEKLLYEYVMVHKDELKY